VTLRPAALALCALVCVVTSLRAAEVPTGVAITDIRLRDNTLIPQAVLDAKLLRYRGRVVRADELLALTRELTTWLIEQGYVTSGVILPDQKLEGGIVYLEVVPGRIAGTTVSGTHHLSDRYIVARLGPLDAEPLNVTSIARRLQLLERDPRIAHLNASVRPGAERGSALLTLDVEEVRSYGFSIGIDNHLSPNVGEQEATLDLYHLNLLGFGDALSASLHYADGFEGGAVTYSVPLNRHDTTVQLSFERSESQIVTEPFASLAIEGTTTRYGIELRHPFVHTLDTEFALTAGLRAETVESFLLGEPFAFSAADDDGVSKTTVASFAQEWVRRSPTHVLALRSSFNAGIDALDATIGGDADGDFLYWLGQAQWVQKLPWRNLTLALRGQVRLANDTLPSSHKYPLGGATSVRGYRENLITRDNGAFASLELSLPIARLSLPGLSRSATDGEIRVAPFVDYGYGRDDDDRFTAALDIASVGLGVTWQISPRSLLELQAAHALIDRPVIAQDRVLQDDGIHFSVRLGF
jgi:hemolysin activation/secretion protein